MEPQTPPRAHNPRDVPVTPATPRFGTFADLPDAERKHARTRTPHRRKRSAAELATPRQTPHKRKHLATPKQQQLFSREPELRLVEEEDAEHEEAETEAESSETESDGLGIELSDGAYESEVSEDEQHASPETRSIATRDAQPQTPIKPQTPIQRSAPHSTKERDAARLEARLEPGKAYEPHKTSESLEALEARKAPEPYVDWGHPHQDKPPPNVPGMWYVFRGKKVFRPLPPGAKPIEPVNLFKKQIEERRRVTESEEDTDVENLW